MLKYRTLWMGSLILLAGAIGADVASASQAPQPTHVVVYQQEGRFAGWPANHGIWSWTHNGGLEILVGFEVGFFQQREGFHAVDYDRPAEHVLARSLDGGQSWVLERPDSLQPPPGIRVAGIPSDGRGRVVRECPGGMPFDHPDFILTARMADIHVGPSRFYWSTDRGRSWEGPFRLPDFDQPGVAARTDYFVEGPDEALLLLTAAKSNRREGRAFCARTRDGGKSWQFQSFIGPEPAGFAIQPSSVRLSSDEILTAVRRREGSGASRRAWIEGYRSLDRGLTWRSTGSIAEAENPASLIRLRDGRLAITYGFRSAPYGIRAKISADGGKTWGVERIIRQDGGNRDLGYPRSVERLDGKIVTVYYFNDHKDRERYIAATIWAPGPFSEPRR